MKQTLWTRYKEFKIIFENYTNAREVVSCQSAGASSWSYIASYIAFGMRKSDVIWSGESKKGPRTAPVDKGL